MSKSCAFAPACQRPFYARGLCTSHYQMWRRGTLQLDAKRSRAAAGATHAEVFESTPKVETASGCIEWSGHRTRYGYGLVQSKVHGNTGAHRIAYTLANGPIVDKWHVLHKCDNPPCVNPDHLFLGRDKENVADMIAKKRHCYGERAPRSKLTEVQVREILARYAAGDIGRPELAREYGVSAATIQKITQRRMWKHVA